MVTALTVEDVTSRDPRRRQAILDKYGVGKGRFNWPHGEWKVRHGDPLTISWNKNDIFLEETFHQPLHANNLTWDTCRGLAQCGDEFEFLFPILPLLQYSLSVEIGLEGQDIASHIEGILGSFGRLKLPNVILFRCRVKGDGALYLSQHGRTFHIMPGGVEQFLRTTPQQFAVVASLRLQETKIIPCIQCGQAMSSKGNRKWDLFTWNLCQELAAISSQCLACTLDRFDTAVVV